jgi:polyhydroxybutyrate depolymerase
VQHQIIGRLACSLVVVGATALSCSSDDNTGGPSVGGSPGTGGAKSTPTGGTAPTPTGGAAPTPTGGAPTGGMKATGGTSTGGASPTGGAAGGTPPASGGSGGGGGMGKGGASLGGGGSGGAGVGGASGAGGSAGASGSGGGSGGGAATGKSAGCGSATTPPKSGNYMISVGGANRSYILKVPDNYDANKAYKLMFSYHWLNGTAQNVSSENYYGLWGLSEGSMIFVAPQGNGNAWRDAGSSKSQGGEDINFTKALVTDIKSKFCIDNGRVFAEGFSMGGSMSYAAACAMGDVFRAIAVHSGGPMSGCVTHDKPVAYFMTHGTSDSVCTYPGFGVPQINDFAKVNGCTARDMPVPNGSAHSCVDFEGCMTGYPARACIFNGDHQWNPSGNWVSGESWKFFSQF